MNDEPAFQTIVLGTDGSRTARIAEGAATLLARATGAQLLVVSVSDGDRTSRLAADAAVSEARTRARASGVDARSEVVEGEPAAALVEFADRVNAELIVVGDVGIRAGRRLRLGGIPDRISHSAPCSMLIVRTGGGLRRATAADSRPDRYRSILIATDGSPTAAHAAHVGANLARALRASITLANAGDELMGRIVLKDTAERLGESDLPYRIASGEPGKVIAQLADELESDLVVVGNKGIAGARRVLGSVPNTVSHNAACDVLIVHTVGRGLADLQPGEGAIVEDKGRKVAGYRDASGQLTVLSKRCTHLGCSVQWNAGLQTWDCPCHGSRFDHRGKVVKGPAQRDLEGIQIQ